jgi:peptide/nickel transport system permease protein
MAARQWLAFLGRRLVSLLLVSAALVVVTFLMVRLIPGDPTDFLIGANANPAELALARKQFGIDQPLTVQFASYVSELLRGNLGLSFVTREPVTNIISTHIGSSLELASIALLLVLGLSMPSGIIAAALTRENRHPKGELVFTGVTSTLGSLPEFLAATFLAFVFAVWLRALPVAGSEGWESLVLPALAITLRPIAVLARVVRVETLNVLAQDYIRTARSKRLPPHLIYLRHVLPNAVTAALTVGGLLFAGLVGGAVIVENVFARAGLGTELVAAVIARNYPVIQGIVLILGFGVVLINAAIDLMLGMLDPRSLARRV